MIIDVTDIELTPGNFAKDCLDNGSNYINCCCDECDYLMCCTFDNYIEKCQICKDNDCPRLEKYSCN